MKREGTLNRSCWGLPSIDFPEGDRIIIHEIPRGFKNGEKVEITLIELNGSATWNMEHCNS